MEVDLQTIGIRTIQEASEKGSLIFNEESIIDEFNRACDHITVLLSDALHCFKRESWGTCVFLSITAIEEVAKADVSIYRRKGKTENIKRSKDKIFNHQEKHRMAILPTVFMGERLEAALGKERCSELLKEAARGEFRTLREASLYFSNNNGQFETPANAVSQGRAREFLLLALETADDRLVGCTNHTRILEAKVSEMFNLVSNS